MLGKEVCLFSRPLKEHPLFSVAWFYPNSYAVGMAGLGYQLVWRLLEEDRQVLVRRGFTDAAEAGIEASELLGFTLSWELDIFNIMSIVGKQGVKLLSCDRVQGDALVFGGGPVLTANPEPYADFFDVILLGDAEAVVPAFLNQWKQARMLPSRQEQLESLATISGVYVPSLYSYKTMDSTGPIQAIQATEPAPSFVGKPLYMPPPEYVAHSVILTSDTTWGDMFLAEIVRSCPQECRFCLASYLTRPFRHVNVDAVIEAITLALPYTKRIGLLGPSVTEHPYFDEIAARLREHTDIDISIASIRADTISDTVLSMLKTLGQRSVTIAIESGSQRLRDSMKKNLTEQEILNAVALIDKWGFESVKFYLIAGLPEEEQADLEETVRLMLLLKKKHRKVRFVAGISSFVPKAQTPYQWHGRQKDCGKRIEFLRKNLAPAGIEVRPESHNWSDIQALLSRGDRRLTKVLLEVAQSDGKLGSWKKALKEYASAVPSLEYYAFRQIPYDEVLPWHHLTQAGRTDYLQKHSLAAAMPK